MLFDDGLPHGGPQGIRDHDGEVMPKLRMHQYCYQDERAEEELATFPLEYYMHPVVVRMFFA